jgi:hypothetical protein
MSNSRCPTPGQQHVGSMLPEISGCCKSQSAQRSSTTENNNSTTTPFLWASDRSNFGRVMLNYRRRGSTTSYISIRQESTASADWIHYHPQHVLLLRQSISNSQLTDPPEINWFIAIHKGEVYKLDMILCLADLQGTSMHCSSEADQHTDMPWRCIPALHSS